MHWSRRVIPAFLALVPVPDAGKWQRQVASRSALAPAQVAASVPTEQSDEMTSDPMHPSRSLHLRGAPSPRWDLGAAEGPSMRAASVRTPALVEDDNPCALPARDVPEWRPAAGNLVWTSLRPPPTQFDLVIHVFGRIAARARFAASDSAWVFAAPILPSNADLIRRFAGPGALERLVSAIEAGVSKHSGAETRARHVALVSWSRGYEAIGTMLSQSRRQPDAVVLLDGLHTAKDRATAKLQLSPFIDHARRAASGDAFFFASHSSITPPYFAAASTSVHRLIGELGGRPVRVEFREPSGLKMMHAFSAKGFHARGYAGGHKADHCSHLELYPLLLDALDHHFSEQS